MPSPALSVFASKGRAAGQSVRPPMLANALVTFDGGQASLGFDGASRFGSEDRTIICGSKGTLKSVGPDLSTQAVTLTTEAGVARPSLDGTWFTEGFVGTMGALLEAVERNDRPPLRHASHDTSPPNEGGEETPASEVSLPHSMPRSFPLPPEGGEVARRRRDGVGELLSAGTTLAGIRPLNSARRNLDSLALVFAAIASARRNVPVTPGTVRSLAEAQR
jgi:hypothetical protein